MLSSFKVFSQNLEKIEKADTVYIYFKSDKEQHQIHHREKTLNKGLIDNYFFSFPNGQLSFQFEHHYKFFPDIRKEKRSFLKKKKDLIINYDFVEKTGNLRIAELIGYGVNAKKVVYVIDNDEIGCFRVILKQIGVVGPIRINEE